MSILNPTVDRIHDATRIYRALLECVSRPGTIRDIGALAAKFAMPCPADNIVMALSLSLLDKEVSYFVTERSGNQLANAIRHMTFSRHSKPEDADYVFLHNNRIGPDELHILSLVKRGTLEQPDESATVFVCVEEIVELPVSEARWVLIGPGIAESAGCELVGLPSAFVVERNRLNAEYPLGVDVVFYTPQGRLSAWPRTTLISGVNV